MSIGQLKLAGILVMCGLVGASAALAQGTAPKSASAQAEPGVLLHLGVTAGKVADGKVSDATGKISGAVIQGNPVRTTIGPGEGYQFDGAKDWLLLAEDFKSVKSALPVRDFTVTTWVNLQKTTQYGSIIGTAQDNGNSEAGWMLGYSEDTFYLALASKGADDGDGKMTYLKGKTQIEPNKWYCVTGTYDGRAMKLYVNGQLEAESREQSGELLYPTDAPYTLGCYKDKDEQFPMAGTLLEVRLMDRVLNATQVMDEFMPGAKLSSYEPPANRDQRFVVKPFLQNATTDSMTIMWETSVAAVGWVEYGEELPYTQETPHGPPAKIQEIRLTGLKPETNYFYRVHSVAPDGSQIVSDDLTFQTAMLFDSPYAFCIIGDTQKNKPVIAKLQEFAWTLRPNFEIHLGDVVNTGADKAEWTEELLPASWPLMSRVCLYPSIGNHEDNHSNYYNYFSLPSPEYYYTYTYGNAQFFVLDTNKPVNPGSEQWKWLETEMSKSKAVWKFAYHHHPVYSSDENDYGDTYKGKSTFGAAGQRHLAEMYEKYGLDICFTGHIHSYERTWPIYQGKVDEKRGVRYITAGGGGGGLEQSGPNRAWISQRVYRGHHIGYAMVLNKTLQLQVFDLEGRLIDQMEIRKP